MSNGTRIDPEEREPRAIKIRQPKHTGRKIVLSVLAVLSAVLVIGAGVFAYINFGGYFEFDKFGKTAEESSSSESEPEIPEEPESVPEIPEESEPEPVIPEESAEPEVPEEPVEPEKPEIPKDEWFMLLVNKENPLSEDFSIEAVTIDAKGHTVDARIAEDLSAMISAGEAEGLDFVIQTAFRTYAKQKEFFEAGTTDAAPGTSEHNSGLAIDIGCATGNFVGSPEEAWLLEHAHEYGFILRYPAEKTDVTGFSHEPWHFRYVGKEQAALIKESGLCLEEYLSQ